MNLPGGWSIWLTGLPAAGKTTHARALQRRLSGLKVGVVVLVSDDVRPVPAPGAAYGEADRDGFYGQLVSLAELPNREGAGAGPPRASRHRLANPGARVAASSRWFELHTRLQPSGGCCPHPHTSPSSSS